MEGVVRPAMRDLPQVQRLLEAADCVALVAAHGRPAVLAALREALAAARVAVQAGGLVPSSGTLVGAAGLALAGSASVRLGRVINATGIVLHTNLGRAPLAEEAVTAMVAATRGYANLEFDLLRGGRGGRTQEVEALLCRLTGADAGLAVNNCAAAVLLALSSLAAGGEVIVSRGELVEIGGGFRVPDVIQQGGARLVEVGTTNKTRLADYEAAIGPATRVLLKVHPSNFRVTGFVEEAPLGALAALARRRGLLLVQDLGSGAVAPGMGPTVQDSVAAGVDVVAFSGDKLLGGPQAGLLAGRAAAIDPMRRHPLLRALRLDKGTLAAMEATLRLHVDGQGARVPVLRMLRQDEAALRSRAARLAGLVGGTVVESTGFAGGGSLPGSEMRSAAVRLGGAAEALALRLRAGRPPVVGRVQDGAVLLDVLAVADAEVELVATAVREAMDG